MGRIRVLNRTAPVTKANYAPTEDCLKAPHSCDMDEPLLLFLFLYANWTSYGEGNAVKAEIRNRWNRSLKPDAFNYRSSHIIVGKKRYFAADDMAKQIFLPYLDIPAAERLFLNKNRLRTIYSNYFGYPGLFGIAFGVTGLHPVVPPINIGSNGSRHGQVMPHGAFPLFLHPASRSYGVVWYATMLNSTYSQTSIGVMDSISITGECLASNVSICRSVHMEQTNE